jgi:hypothetical protein
VGLVQMRERLGAGRHVEQVHAERLGAGALGGDAFEVGQALAAFERPAAADHGALVHGRTSIVWDMVTGCSEQKIRYCPGAPSRLREVPRVV